MSSRACPHRSSALRRAALLSLVSLATLLAATPAGAQRPRAERPAAGKSKPEKSKPEKKAERQKGTTAGTASVETTAAEKPGAESKLAGTAKASAVNVVGTEENKEGVKTYQFGATEVEGRLRSPQLTYFLRRVRAEFSAGDLGHRSFMRELSETTRHPSFR